MAVRASVDGGQASNAAKGAKGALGAFRHRLRRAMGAHGGEIGGGDLIPRAASSPSVPSDGRSDFNSRQSRPRFLFHPYFDVLQLDEGPHLVPIYIVRWI